ncbi:MAG: UvrD-helicase domain-containing protein [Paludibacteraceae bacterium]|nr:UvrD-helicase domain-containing protein [Paludibacteraceae bacterium]
MGNLAVYKASAGSGKTQTISEQYIKMLINAKYADNEQFRHILAVTFTNKATDEMKSRIVDVLYKASKQDTPTKIADTVLTPEKAKSLLSAILHNYSFFRITTIDKFFQQIIRAFVHELGINSNYAVELDEKQVINDTIADIMLKLGDKGYEPFMSWFYDRMIGDTTEFGDNISFSKLKTELEEFSTQILQEKYSSIKDQIPSDAEIKTLSKDLRTKSSAIINALRKQAKEILERIKAECLDMDVCKNGSFGVILALAAGGNSYPEINKTFAVWEQEVPMPKKADPALALSRQAMLAAYNTWLGSAIRNLISSINAGREEYYNCNVIAKNLNYVLLFRSIEKEIDAFTKKENTQLLSKSGDFINRIIDGSDTPFIYEKVGSFIEHYFIDEFQDTSKVQWHNFVPLIDNSLSNGDENLIVGDIKQSIYRFRDSDWSILEEDVQNKFPDAYNGLTLQNNHRSFGNIIRFNNKLFKGIAQFTQDAYNAQSGRMIDRILKAYADVEQNIPKPQPDKPDNSAKGYVEINFTDKDYDVLHNILEQINSLKEQHGYKGSDIGILVRKNKEAQEVAAYLLENGVNVISEEALRIGSNTAINDIISILGYITDKNNRQNAYIVENIINKEAALDFENLAKMPLYEIVEQVIFSMGYARSSANIPYLNALKDIISEYTARNGAGIREFLEWWNSVGQAKSITTTSAASDAVNILTLHKSKGLAFKVVIMYEIGWKFHTNQHKEILWEKIPDIGYVPIEYTPTLKNTMFRERYYNEVLMDYIDNLNFLYVAFTRAKEVLIAYCTKATKSPFDKMNEKEFSNMYPIFLSGFTQNVENMQDQYIIGSIPVYEKTEDTVISTAEATDFDEMSPEEKMKRFPLRGTEFKAVNAEHGTRMHGIMENIVTKDDIQPYLEEMLFKGYITKQQHDDLVRDITIYVTNPDALQWFDGSRRAVSERGIVNVENGKHYGTRRPDRVLIDRDTKEVTIIDYKFGENEEPAHLKQVKGYIDLYKKTGYTNVTGYVYYFNGLKIVKV